MERQDIPRIDQIDTIRVLAAWLRCILHTLVPFMVFDNGIWVIHYDNLTSLIPDFLVLTFHSFIMEAFFIVAGLIFILELEKKGMISYIKNRFKRIFIPFIIGLFILIPYILILFSISKSLVNNDFNWQFDLWINEALHKWIDNLFVLAHLWFLYYLIFYYIIILLLLKLNLFNINLKDNKLKIFARFVLPVLFLCLLNSKHWYIENPLTTQIEWTSFVYFLIFFVTGIFIKPHFSNLCKLINYRKTIIVTFVLLSVLGAYLQSLVLHPVPDYQEMLRYVALVVGLMQTLAGVSVLYIITFKNKLKETKFFKFQVKSAYWTYLIHVPIVMTIHLLLYPLEIHLFLKFLIAFTVSMSIANLLYPVIGRKLLNL